MVETAATQTRHIGRAGLWTVVVAAILGLLDGIAVLGINSPIAPSVGGPLAVGAVEIILALLALGALYYYKGHPAAVAGTVGVLAFLGYFFDGGFYYVGATLAIIGAVLIYYRR